MHVGLERTSPGLDDLLDLLPSVHGAKVERLYDRSGCCKFWRVVRRGRKLLNDFATYTSRWLFPIDHGAISEIAFNEKDHLFISNEDLVAAYYVEPSLY